VNKLQSELKFVKEQYERAENAVKEEREGRRRLEEELRVVRGQLADLHTRSRSKREEHDASHRAAIDEDYFRKVQSEKESLEVRLSHASVKEEAASARIEELTRYGLAHYLRFMHPRRVQ
jgi:chromosome segregation ATPase